jgi:hypothetical protein
MGAVDFSVVSVVPGDDRDAFIKAREEAREYNGHQDGYSGDIQTVSGYRMFFDAPRFGTKAFRDWEDDILMNEKFGIEKRGAAGCVEIKGVKLKEIKKRHGMKGKRGVRAFYFFGWAAE